MDDEERRLFAEMNEKLDVMHEDIARLIFKSGHPNINWMDEAIEFIKEKEIVFTKDLYNLYKQLNNGNTNKIFNDLIGQMGITRLSLYAKGKPSFLFYKKSPISPIFLKLWQTQYTTRKILYIRELEPDDRQAFKEWFEKQPLFIKFFTKTDDFHYIAKRSD